MACVHSCWRSELGEPDPLQDAFAEIAKLQEKLAYAAIGDNHHHEEYARLEAENARLRAVLKECADDLAERVTHQYAGMLHYPHMKVKQDRDLALVIKARELLDDEQPTLESDDEMTEEIAARRFGPGFEKVCRRPDIIECAHSECQMANECRYEDEQSADASDQTNKKAT